MANEIRFIIDMDGFTVDKRFVPKELGVVDIRTRQSNCFRFLLPTPYRYLSRDVRKGIWFVENFCHGLRYSNDVNDRPPEEIYKVVSELILACGDSEYTAYKGGQVERELLVDELKFSRVINLESLGCPKFDELIQSPAMATLAEAVYFPKNKCRHHHSVFDKENPQAKKSAHCPVLEVCYNL